MILWELTKVFVVSLIGINGIMLMAMVVAEATKFGFGPGQILAVIPLIIPSILPYTIPGTTLFATCIVYGRLAADNEILAIKSAGINLLHVVHPALLLGLVMSGCTMALYFEVIPRTFHTMRTMVFNDAQDYLYSLLRKNKSIASTQKPFYSMDVKDVEGWRLIEPTFKERDEHYNLKVVARAREADLQVDIRDRVLRIRMRDTEGINPADGSVLNYDTVWVWEMPLPPGVLEASKPSARAMTWQEMLQRRRECLAKKAQVESQVEEVTRMLTAMEQGMMTVDPLLPKHRDNLQNEISYYTREVLLLDVEMLMRPALSLGCLCFILVGCPVGIWFSRSDYLSAFITCFLPIVFIYYPLLLCGIGLAKYGRINPTLLVWGANALVGVIGIVLFWRLLKH
jgi:lipopolysaccharide export system permease protein